MYVDKLVNYMNFLLKFITLVVLHRFWFYLYIGFGCTLCVVYNIQYCIIYQSHFFGYLGLSLYVS